MPHQSGRPSRSALGMHWMGFLCCLGVLFFFGCQRHAVPKLRQLPKHCEIELDQLRIRSDTDLDRRDPLLGELINLRKEIQATLRLPPASRPVTVYLFRDETRYAQYMQQRHPNLPARRAFFIGTPTELMVYAYWGDKTREDLRHEYTHGVLHASLKTVPLWLDEGLAEYFEVAPDRPVGLNQDHSESLSIAIQNGWHPNLKRLEMIDDVSQMQRSDYQEAWAWVHYLLQGTPDGPPLITEYLKTLRHTSHAPSFSNRMAEDLSEGEERLTVHVASLNLGVMRASHTSPEP